MLTFYHGTSSVIGLKPGEKLLPPVQTNNKREDWRKKTIDKVFFTPSTISAKMYAKKACRKYGGHPIVFEVKPIGCVWNPNVNEYVADSALILKIT